jgi:hypothetical protein
MVLYLLSIPILHYLEIKGRKVKVKLFLIPSQAINQADVRGSGDTVPHILNLGTNWRR